MDTEKDDTIDTIKDIATITYTKVYKEVITAYKNPPKTKEIG